MTGYLNARAAGSAPQTIPQGFGGYHDWDAIDDAERARRGWVVPQTLPVDPDFERVAVEFVEGEDGWRAVYTAVSIDLDVALANAFRLLGDRAWRAEVGGMTFNGMVIPTDREVTQGRAISAGLAAQADPTMTVDDWKLAPGVFLTLDNASLVALGQAMSAHVQARFKREGDVTRLLLAKRSVKTLRATLAAEIDKGWPT